MSKIKKPLILFDFDGTLTRKDSMPDFIRYAVGSTAFIKGLCKLFPMFIAFGLKRLSNHQAKEKLIAHFFKGWDVDKFQLIADRYSLEEIDKIIRPEAWQKLRWHLSEGHHVVIVSASIESWLTKWCEKWNIPLLSTRLEIKEGRLTGKFENQNCRGPEKVKRIKEMYDLSEFSKIYAYGDSDGDKEMLELADKSYFRIFP